jgi:hypothetical protein
MRSKKNEITQNRISQLATDITVRLRDSIQDIQSVNDDIHVLSINAKILAAKAGQGGRAFAVVADSVRGMVARTQKITDTLQVNVESTVGELRDINAFLGTKVRADRLSQVAESMIDVVDRNLYERSCDVRWWATESAVVQALETRVLAPEVYSIAAEKCSERLGVILNSYTVYLDIVVCDLSGCVIANGRPALFRSVGTSVADTEWFRSAQRTSSGNDFGFQGVHRGGLAGGAPALVYSCGVREGGDANGKLIGVLGIVFNWDGLGKVVVSRAVDMLSPETDQRLSARLLYADGTVIASAGDMEEISTVPAQVMGVVASSVRGVILPESKGDGIACGHCIAGHAASKGFETYRTGWYAMIAESIDA